MPYPGLPPTPAASTDLLAKENVKQTTDYGFSLGPPAIQSAESSASSDVSVKSDSSYRPKSPTSNRKRPRQDEDDLPSQQDMNANDYTLPPPPTRSRRIIQMKPGAANKARSTASEKSDKRKATVNKTSISTTAAGKKTARKTAHSIIERRRRSKMNEEFDTLKNMIPACNGQQMHKLAILQAGIDYMRYLERCVTDLKASSREIQPQLSIPPSQAPTPRQQSVDPSDHEEEEEDEEDEEQDENDNVDMENTTIQAEGLPSDHKPTSQGHGYYLPSPGILPQQSQKYHYAISNHSSAAPSPAFGPRNDSWSSIDRSSLSYSLSSNTSPAILPQVARDAEDQASAALLMLNHDRRYSRSDRPTGLSVKDLLSH